MSILEIYYTYAKLSQAAYIDLSSVANPLNPQEIVKAATSKEQERLPEALAKNIFGIDATDTDYWTMLSPYYYRPGSVLGISTGHSDPASGFAGMLLSNPTSGKVLAIAGTEPTSASGTQFVQDLLLSDAWQIGFWGGAFNQLVSLFNYVQELKAPTSDQNVRRLEVVATPEPPTDGSPSIAGLGGIYYSLKAYYDGKGQGQLIGATEKLTVTGHSLGGHVAALAVALFPEIFTTAYTFNAPGYNPVSSTLQLKGVDGLLNLFKDYGANPLAVGSISNRVITLESEDVIPGDDNEVVSSNVTGTSFSPEIYIPTEKVTHDVGHMVESLALQVMLSKLDPNMTKETAGSILAAVTAQPLETYERLLESLNALLTGTKINLPVTGPSGWDSVLAGGGDMADRNVFFEKYFALQDSAAFKTLEGKVTIPEQLPTPTEARTDLSAFLSLYYLTPFVLKTNDAAALNQLYTANEAIASTWNEDRNLTAEELAQGQGNYSDKWLADRAAMLSWMNERNKNDIATEAYISGPEQIFTDKTTNTLYGERGSDTCLFGRGDGYVENLFAVLGSAANDARYEGERRAA